MRPPNIRATRTDTSSPSHLKAQFIAWIGHTASLSNDAATALFDKQQVRNAQVLYELSDDEIDNMCRAIRRGTDQGPGINIAELSVTRLKLISFYVKHVARTSRTLGEITSLEERAILQYKDQRDLELSWSDANPTPDSFPPVTLDTKTAAATFERVRNILSRIRGCTGVPLSYVIRHTLIPPDEEEDPSYFDEEGSTYASIDLEMIARAPILSPRANEDWSLERLEDEGPFHNKFKHDNRLVWSILSSMFSTGGQWQYCKTFTSSQNGRRVWFTLHDHFYGKDRVTQHASQILSKLNSLTYDSNWNFDKFCQAHCEQHNMHQTLVDFGIAPLSEEQKIHYFESGIKNSALVTVKASLIMNREKFTTFERVMRAYSDYKASTKPHEAPAARSVSSVDRAPKSSGRGGRGSSRGSRGGRGRGSDRARRRDTVPQSEIDKCTDITEAWYPPEKYSTFSAAQKLKVQQNRKSSAAASNGKPKSVAELGLPLASVISEITEASSPKKKSADDNDSHWGRNRGNRDNPALERDSSDLDGRQSKRPKA